MLRVPQLHPERKQRVPQHHPGHKQRGRGCCAISGRPGNPSGTQGTRPTSSHFPLSSLFRVLSPTIPVHPRNAPVSPITPVLTQKQGGGGISRHMRSPVTLLFSSAMLTDMLSTIVGAPTISTPQPNTRCPCPHCNHDYPLANQCLFFMLPPQLMYTQAAGGSERRTRSTF
jgi:hypothetical protein